MDLANSEVRKLWIRLMQPLGVKFMLNILMVLFAFPEIPQREDKFQILKSHVRSCWYNRCNPWGLSSGYGHKTCFGAIQCDNSIVPDTSLFGARNQFYATDVHGWFKYASLYRWFFFHRDDQLKAARSFPSLIIHCHFLIR